MIDTLIYIGVCILAYLFGSFNTSIFIGRIFYGIDVRDYGSGNAGATNTMRTLGAKKAIVVLLGDMLKVIVPVIIARLVSMPNAELVAGAFALLGHSKPIFYKFKGGKGVACAAGIVLMYDWRIFLIALGVFAITFLATKIISMATFSVIIALQILVWTLRGGDTFAKVYFIIVGIYVFYLHRENVKRILNGTESKFVKGAKLLKDTQPTDKEKK